MKRGLHPMAKTAMGKAIIALFRQSREPYKPRLVCIGCGCTDNNACPGGCTWSQPGICSACEANTDELLLKSEVADDQIKTRYVESKLMRAPGFSVMSLALVSWLGDKFAADFHRDRLRDGLQLKTFTRVRIGLTAWTFALVYKPPRGDAGITYRIAWRVGSRFAATRKKAKRRAGEGRRAQP